MPLYMIRSHVKPENRDAIMRRYAEAPEPVPGITSRGDWASVHGDGAYHLMEADDVSAIADELLKYNDLCTYTIDPVYDTDTFFALLQKHGLVS
ncbi:MAG: DUF3303 family protein [Pseudomonadota bacterium]